nr:MAG TPA: hypothetical protein [Caudoviricetes sp.]
MDEKEVKKYLHNHFFQKFLRFFLIFNVIKHKNHIIFHQVEHTTFFALRENFVSKFLHEFCL